MIAEVLILRLKVFLLGILLALPPMTASAQDAPAGTLTNEATSSSESVQGLDTAISSVLAAAGSAAEGGSSGVGQSSILLFLGLTVLSLAPAIAASGAARADRDHGAST